MNQKKRICLFILLLVLPVFLSCGGGGSDVEEPGPPPGSTDPAEILASVRYQVANITYSQSASVIAKVMDYNGNRVPDGTPIRFTLNEKNITKTTQAGTVRFGNNSTTFDTTTINGFCSAIVNFVGVLQQACDIATVTIRPIGFIQVYENVDIFFFSNASIQFGLILTAENSTIPGDGFSNTLIRAKIVNSFGDPPQFSGITVTFSSSPSGVGSLSSTTARTNDEGVASVIFTSTKVASPVSVLITATANVPTACFSGSITVSDIISIGLTPQVIGSIVVSAEPTTIFTDGTEDDEDKPNNSTITAIVNDENGFPIIDNTLVKFTSRDIQTDEPLGIIEAFSLTKDGVAQAELKAGLKAGVALITAKDSSETISGTATVVIQGDLVITTESLSPATVGEFYRQVLEAEGGVPPYTWSVSPDSPDQPSSVGLSLTTAESLGILSGTPTSASTGSGFLFIIQVEDSVGNKAVKAFELVVNES